jgi:uncharacterized protein (DUF983 family)
MARRTITQYGRRSLPGTLAHQRSYAHRMKRRQTRPSFGRMLGRALLRRCPHCGGKAWFDRWFKRLDRCRTCGYRYERQPGFLLGALTVNTILTFGLIGAVLLVGSILSYPDIAVVPILVVALAVAVLVPVIFYPFSYTVWAAVDLAMRPLDPAEEADAVAHAGSRRIPEGT